MLVDELLSFCKVVAVSFNYSAFCRKIVQLGKIPLACPHLVLLAHNGVGIHVCLTFTKKFSHAAAYTARKIYGNKNTIATVNEIKLRKRNITVVKKYTAPLVHLLQKIITAWNQLADHRAGRAVNFHHNFFAEAHEGQSAPANEKVRAVFRARDNLGDQSFFVLNSKKFYCVVVDVLCLDEIFIKFVRVVFVYNFNCISAEKSFRFYYYFVFWTDNYKTSCLSKAVKDFGSCHAVSGKQFIQKLFGAACL